MTERAPSQGIIEFTDGYGNTYRAIGEKRVPQVIEECPIEIAANYTPDIRPVKKGNAFTRTIGAITGLAIASTLAVGAGQFAGNTLSKGKLPSSVTETVDYVLPDRLTGDN